MGYDPVALLQRHRYELTGTAEVVSSNSFQSQNVFPERAVDWKVRVFIILGTGFSLESKPTLAWGFMDRFSPRR